jgi:hypothetical protein
VDDNSITVETNELSEPNRDDVPRIGVQPMDLVIIKSTGNVMGWLGQE